MILSMHRDLIHGLFVERNATCRYQPDFESADTSVSACVAFNPWHNMLDDESCFARMDGGEFRATMAETLVQKKYDNV